MSVVPMRLPTPEEADLNNRTSAVRMVAEVLRSGVHGVETLPGALLRAIRLKAWEAFETPLGNVYTNKTMAEWIVSGPPQGLSSSVDRVRQLLTATDRAEEALLEFDREMQRKDGNPTGINQHTKAGTFDNIQGSSRHEMAPTGTSAQAGIRRLRKAVDAGDEKATDLLAKVIDSTSDMSVHSACKEMGWRKDSSPLKTVQAAWRKADREQREEIAAWIDGQMSPLAGSRFT